MPDVFADGIYSLKEAREILRALGMSAGRFRSWLVPRKRQKMWLQSPSYDRVKGKKALSFLDLVEAWVAHELVAAGAKPKDILKLHAAMEQEHGPHPFGRKAIFGSYIGVAEERTGTSGKRVVREANRQLIPPEFADQVMTRIKWSDAGVAEQIEPAEGIILNPRFGLGLPVTKMNKVRTCVLYDAWKAHNENAREIAKWYDIRAREVLAAVKYEQRKRAA